MLNSKGVVVDLLKDLLVLFNLLANVGQTKVVTEPGITVLIFHAGNGVTLNVLPLEGNLFSVTIAKDKKKFSYVNKRVCFPDRRRWTPEEVSKYAIFVKKNSVEISNGFDYYADLI